MSFVLMSDDRFAAGISWDEYLASSNGKTLQRRRYETSPPAELLSLYSCWTEARRIAILSGPTCPDCTWAVPYYLGLLKSSLTIETKIFITPENRDLVEMVSSNGKLSVPKLVLMDMNNRVLNIWGPRPASIQNYVEEHVDKYEAAEWKAEVYRFYRSVAGLSELHDEMKHFLV